MEFCPDCRFCVVQVQQAAEEVKENLDSNKPDTHFCFIQEEPASSPSPQPLTATPGQTSGSAGRRKASMNILNPDSGLGE